MPRRKNQKSGLSPAPAGSPDFSLEAEILEKFGDPVAGIDEAGRGPLAGPVVAAALILDPDAIPAGLNDSKKLNASRRSELFEALCRSAHVSVAAASRARIDRTNIRQATLYAMRVALRGLSLTPACALIDGRDVPNDLICPGEAVVKGDARSLSIAAASIVAKVTRDRMMDAAGLFYPGYGFEKHMGYGTAMHMQALEELGACPLHRTTFRPVTNVIMGFEPDFEGN